MTGRSHTLDDITFFCIRCGKSRVDLVRQPRECLPEDTNVTAISHIVRGKRLRELHSATRVKDERDS